MRQAKFSITLGFGNGGRIDRDRLESNLRFILDRAVDEGLITPDDDNHAALETADLTPI